MKLDRETIRIDQRLSNEEIISSLQSIKNKLFEIFGVSFPDARVVRYFGSYSKNGAEFIDIYFYDESAHSLNSSDTKPLSDYICISFDNFSNYAGDIVRSVVIDGVTYDILYDILIKQNGDIHSDWTGVMMDVEKYRNVTFEPYDLRVIDGTIDY